MSKPLSLAALAVPACAGQSVEKPLGGGFAVRPEKKPAWRFR